MHTSEKISYWEKKTFLENIDTLVIGAGIVGYSTALHLKQSNPDHKIVVIERGILPSGASSKNAGFACFGSATELFSDLESMPEEEVWQTVKDRWEGLKYLREVIGDENLKLQINGSWDLITKNETELYSNTKNKIEYLNQKLFEITEISNVFTVDSKVSEKFGFEGVETSIFNKLEGQIDTASMNHAFYKKIIASDIHVLFNTEAIEIENNNVTTNHGLIKSKNIAICTNGFAKKFITNESINPARAQVIITKPIENLKIKGTFHYNCGYYYFRNIDNRILFGGGRNLDLKGEETVKIENSKLIIDSLKKILKEVILPNTQFEIDHQWAGIMGVGTTKKPIIKKLSENTYCGVRLGGMGVAIGTLVGKQLSDLILNRE